jgi:hypothetical protein
MIMTPTHRTLTMRAVLLAVPVGLLITFAGVTGCAASGQQVLPAALETRLAAQANADDHFAAAMVYQGEAQKQADEAARYERQAAAVGQYMDPKGFRRAGLITAAQTHRREAADMQQLYAHHYNQALTLTGKQDTP